MKLLFFSLGLLFNTALLAEIWEKPPYTPDEGHLLEEIERQEEAPDTQDKTTKEGKHQDVIKPSSNQGFELMDDEMKENEEASP